MATPKRQLNEFEQAAELLPGGGDVEVDNRATRYLFFAGDEPGMPVPGGMSVSTPCVPGRQIRRGQVTPCVSTPVWTRKEEIPEGQMLAGSDDMAHRNGIPGKAAYLLYAGPEANNLLTQYGHATDTAAQWGLVELKALRGKSLEEVQALRVTSRFFPTWPDDVPETNLAMAAHIEAKMKEFEAGNDPDKKVLLACGRDMLTACEHAQEHQSNLAAESNMRVTLSPSDSGYKLAFDERDRVYARRAGVPLATNAMRGNQADGVAQIAQAVQKSLQTPAVNPETIAAIVAATVKAMREDVPAPTPAPVQEDRKPAPKKAA